MKILFRILQIVPVVLLLATIFLSLQTNFVSNSAKDHWLLKHFEANALDISIVLIVIIVVLTVFQQVAQHKIERAKESANSEISKTHAPFLEKQQIENEINNVNSEISLLTEKLNSGTKVQKTFRFFIEKKLRGLEKKRNELSERLKLLNHGLRESGGEEVIRIQRLLSFKGWNIRVGEFKTIESGKVEFYIQKGNEFSPSNRLVHYISGEADYDDIEELKQALKKANQAKGWLIYSRFNSQTKIEDDNISWEQNDELKEICVFDLNNLYFNEIFPLKNYFDDLHKDFTIQKISQYNVPVDGIQPVYDRKGDEIESSNISSINDYIDKWSDSPGQNQVAIFGDFGVGKTWFCKQYILKQLDLMQHKPLKRIPLLFFLNEYKNKINPRDLFRHFCDKYRIESVTYELFDELNKQGKLILILDGLDEIADEKNIERVYDDIIKLCVANSKVMLTSRRTLFRNSKQRQNFIKHTRSKNQVSAYTPNFEIIRLEEFDKSQIETFIQNRYPGKWRQYWQQLSGLGKGNLFKLAKTPVMLEIILSGFKKGDEFGENDTAADLYEKFTAKWLKRATKTDNSLKGELRLKIIHLIAWQMFERQQSSILHSELSKFFSDLSGEELKKTHDFLADLTSETEPLENDVRRQSFLKRDSMGKYFFAHKSFLDYFVALKLASDINNNKQDPFAGYQISPEIISFLKDISFDANIVFNWFDEHRLNHAKDKDSNMQGNALTLLAKKKYALTGRDFSGCVIKNADLSGANFEGCDFTGAVFESVNLRDCNLDRTNFTGAVLEGLILGVRSPAKSVAFSPDGKHIASGKDNNSVVLLKRKNKNWEYEKEIKGHTDSITSLTFDSGSELVASCSFDKTVRLFKINSLKTFEVLEHEETVYDAKFYGENDQSRDGVDFIFTASGATIKLWLIKVKKDDIFAEEISSYTEHQKPIYKLAISADKKYLASAGFDKKVGLWKIERDKNTLGLKFDKPLEDHQHSVNGVAFSPNGEYLASSDNEGKIFIRSVAGGKVSKIFDSHQGIVWDISYSSSGNYLASCSLDKTVRLWNMKKQEEISALKGHTGNVWSVCFSPGEDFIVSSSFDNTVKIWNRDDGKCLQEISMGESTHGNFSCLGMRLENVKGLSDFQKMYLNSCGAKI